MIKFEKNSLILLRYIMDEDVNNDKNKAEEELKLWKLKKMLDFLEHAKGDGTSMISLIIPPGDQISKVSKMLSNEHATASNIKSRVNRQSVQDAITSVLQRLKLFNVVPPNGLVIYCGNTLTEHGIKQQMISFEPPKPINTSLYVCDNRFHVDSLQYLFKDESVFGFIVVDGSGCLYGTVSGNVPRVLQTFTVDLPNKHGRGGQSALRFSRLREEKRQNYIRKVAEGATAMFIENDKCNVEGLILAGSADLKTTLSKSDLFDPRLASKIIKIVDVSYGDLEGFKEAISLSSDLLGNVKLVKEKKLIEEYFDHINRNTGMFCFGIKDTLAALENGAVDKLVVWEDLPDEYIFNANTNIKENVLEYLVENHKKYGATLHLISDKTSEGSQLCKGFGGCVGILRFRMDFTNDYDEVNEDDTYDDFL